MNRSHLYTVTTSNSPFISLCRDPFDEAIARERVWRAELERLRQQRLRDDGVAFFGMHAPLTVVRLGRGQHGFGKVARLSRSNPPPKFGHLPRRLLMSAQGVRRDVSPHLLKPGEYGRFEEDGKFHGWYAIPGDTDPADWMCANLTGHEVVEHEDGTITVNPSILIGGHNRETGARKEWHGFLERGVWRQV